MPAELSLPENRSLTGALIFGQSLKVFAIFFLVFGRAFRHQGFRKKMPVGIHASFNDHFSSGFESVWNNALIGDGNGDCRIILVLEQKGQMQ